MKIELEQSWQVGFILEVRQYLIRLSLLGEWNAINVVNKYLHFLQKKIKKIDFNVNVTV